MTIRYSPITIRPASEDDKNFIVSMVPRLVEFGPPAWRNADQLTATDLHQFIGINLMSSDDSVVFIAEDKEGYSLGFVQLQTGSDYYYKEKHGHIANLIVAADAEGRGVARLLIEKSEQWARSKGFRFLTLSVFAQNLQARKIYNRLGYGEDIMKYVKELD